MPARALRRGRRRRTAAQTRGQVCPIPFGVLRGESAGRGSAGQGAVLGSQRGFCLWATRLEAVAVHSRLVEGDPRETDWTGLKLLLEGIAPRRIQRR
ncbi:MAG: hypothetical protein IPJ27_11220 [Candidatus Accumulibacter sp.]|uniref:Uncharacterized protein n=1 Tax=Candidatus Accumulibacter proximus TaxID=2954385 RepID=A0A935Q0H7_9PROT|nr:hypothetical protein [Candidatus Accumulibacter proximus]